MMKSRKPLLRVEPTLYKPQAHGQIEPIEPPTRESPVLPMILRANGLTHNLPYDEALEKYGLWKVTILKTCSVHGKLLRPGDTAKLTGDVVQLLVGQGRAAVTDPRLAEESKIIDQAAALGLPQKIRELASFAPSKKNKWPVRPEANEEKQFCFAPKAKARRRAYKNFDIDMPRFFSPPSKISKGYDLSERRGARCRRSNAVWHGEDPHGGDLNRHLLSMLSCGSTLELCRQNKGDCR
jgi:hypothetical protein